MDLKYLQDRLKIYGEKAKERSERLNIQLPNYIAFPFCKLIEEIGEVAELLEKRYGIHQEISEEEFKKRFGEELSDVIIFLTHLANFSEVDLEEAINKKLGELEDKVKRD